MMGFYDVSNFDEPIKYIYDKYCKEDQRKMFALGLSMGASHLTNVIGNQSSDCKLTAAFIV